MRRPWGKSQEVAVVGMVADLSVVSFLAVGEGTVMLGYFVGDAAA